MEVKSFEEFINTFKLEDKENYNKYSKIRSKYTYVIIYNSFYKEFSEVTYNDVNSFVRYDKALKYILYKFLGTFEEYLKACIFDKYEIKEQKELKKYDKKDIFVKNNKNYEITNLYKNFQYHFKDIIKFLKDHKIEEIDLEKIDEVRKLRNLVMHHGPLLFDFNFNFLGEETSDKINILKNLLPFKYGKTMTKEINELRDVVKKNINKKYYKFLLVKLEV